MRQCGRGPWREGMSQFWMEQLPCVWLYDFRIRSCSQSVLIYCIPWALIIVLSTQTCYCNWRKKYSCHFKEAIPCHHQTSGQLRDALVLCFSLLHWCHQLDQKQECSQVTEKSYAPLHRKKHLIINCSCWVLCFWRLDAKNFSCRNSATRFFLIYFKCIFCIKGEML